MPETLGLGSSLTRTRSTLALTIRTSPADEAEIPMVTGSAGASSLPSTGVC